MRKLVQLKDINGNDLDSKNLNYENRITKLENSWNLVSSVTGRTYLNIPTGAKEVKMITYLGDIHYTCDLLVDKLSTTYKYVKLGNATDYVHYEYNGTGIRCVQAFIGGTSHINDATTYMYYK